MSFQGSEETTSGPPPGPVPGGLPEAEGERGWRPPPTFDGYRLVAGIGGGAMGEVYLAYDALLDRLTAIKFLDPRQEDPGNRRLLVEARALARLQHPNVAAIYRVGETEGRPFLVSEYVRGKSLDRLSTPLDEAEVRRIGIALARGLAAAHRRGVLHRDIKPANAILSDTGEAKLVDFGLAKLLDAEEAAQPPEPSAPRERADATQGGAWLGTPAYMAPEIWRGEPATFRSDVYSLGALLYQLRTGRPPHQAESMDALRRAVLEQKAPKLSPEGALERALHRALAKEPSERLSSAEALCDALEAEDRPRALAPPDGNPYRGLHAFEAEHRAVFFGRDPDVRVVIDRLRAERLVLVAGTSGVGKSSLCRAGVLPAVAEGALGEGAWRTVGFTPGRHPVRALAAALAPHLDADEATLAADILEAWPEVERQLRQAHRDGTRLALFIDQLEELVTLSEPEEARALAEVLDSFSAPGEGPRLLATCRGDFIARVASLPGMGELTRALHLLRPLTPEGVREAVCGPARLRGVAFASEALVQTLVDAAAVEGALPLLQFALAELWEVRDVAAGRIPASALEAIGGVEGALARHADGVLARLLPQQRAAARRIFSLLVTLEGTRARRTDAELGADSPDVQAALRSLVSDRLLVASEAAEADGSAYEVAHEALIRAWPTLRGWLEEDAEQRVVRARLDAALGEWERARRPADLLWRRRQLADLERLDASALTPHERAFIAASRRAVRRRRWWAVVAGLGALLLIVSGYAWLQLRAHAALATRIAERVQAGTDQLERARTEQVEVKRAVAAALELFDAGDLARGERAWEQAQAKRAAVDGRALAAGQAFEAALNLGPSAEARAGLADALLMRVLRARAEHQPDGELLDRLALYDDDGSRRARLDAPAHLTVSSSEGSALTLARYGADFALGPARPLVQDAALAPGSYLVTSRAPGGAEVRLPILLSPGESRTLALHPPASVPAGFVFIPGGTFLSGSPGPTALRQGFLSAAPLHPVRTGAFLIARHETTFAEWLAFLDALPAAARAARLPRVGTGGFRGALALSRTRASWRLDFEPAGQRFHLLEGERLRYPGRTHLASVDWRTLPVVGISAPDAEAYVAWLRQSGRVPGARLCGELEWERAARGADGRPYPGGAVLDPSDANFDRSHPEGPHAAGPDPVGAHPGSRSPFGVDDLAGNVWEWTRAFDRAGGYTARGGSYAYGDIAALSANRERLEPGFRDVALGLRVCADAPERR